MKYLLIGLLIMIAVYNGYLILWGTEHDAIKRKHYSKVWHGIGLALRIGIFAIPFFYFTNFVEVVKWTLLFISVGGVLYDFIINFIRYIYKGEPELFYVDNKGWNAVFLKFLSPVWYWIFRGVFVLGTIIVFVL